jgi:hypothetical protein
MLAQAKSASSSSTTINTTYNKSIENASCCLIDARNNRNQAQLRHEIEGFRSEQISNRIALEKEAIDLTKTRTEAETTLALEQKRFNAELEKDELKKLDIQRQDL